MRVLSTAALTCRMQRLVLAPDSPQDDLDRFATDRHLHVRLLFPPPGCTVPAWPVLQADGRIGWPGGYRMVERKYTLRHIDAAVRTATVDMVRHPEREGPGSCFAASARPGDLVGMAGPGGGGLTAADWYLLAGDESALPAIGRLLETLPSTARGTVLLEVDEPEERMNLHAPAGMIVHWLFRQGAPAGATSPLASALCAVRLPQPGVRPFAWVAGEAGLAQTARDFLRKERGLVKGQHLVVAYWRHGQADNPPEDHDHDHDHDHGP